MMQNRRKITISKVDSYLLRMSEAGCCQSSTSRFNREVRRIIPPIDSTTLPKSNPPIPLRVLDYYVRLKRQYNTPVTQVVIFLQQSSDPIAFTEEYTDEFTNHRYQVIRL